MSNNSKIKSSEDKRTDDLTRLSDRTLQEASVEAHYLERTLKDHETTMDVDSRSALMAQMLSAKGQLTMPARIAEERRRLLENNGEDTPIIR